MISINLVCMDNLSEVERTLDSVNCIQDLIKEIIIVDSSKNREIENYVRRLDQFTVHYKWEKPKGVYHAMNSSLSLGVEEVLIWFLNPGDVLIDPEVLRKLHLSIFENKSMWGFAQAIKYTKNGKEIFPTKIKELAPKALALGDLSISHQSMLCQKKVLRYEIKLDERFKIAADLKNQIEILKKYGNPAFILRIMVEIDPNGISHRKLFRTLMETSRVRYESKTMNLKEVISKIVEFIMRRLNR